MKMLHVNHTKSLGNLESSAATKDTFAVRSSWSKLIWRSCFFTSFSNDDVRTGIALIQCLQALSDTSKKKEGGHNGRNRCAQAAQLRQPTCNKHRYYATHTEFSEGNRTNLHSNQQHVHRDILYKGLKRTGLTKHTYCQVNQQQILSRIRWWRSNYFFHLNTTLNLFIHHDTRYHWCVQ